MRKRNTGVPEAKSAREISLKELHGLGPARAWGEQLARDIAAFRAGEISWEDVDRGVLVHGPPGTGKTLFARALAASCGMPLIATSYAQWQSSGSGHLGNLTRAMRSDFKKAMARAPSVLFIDEIDAFPMRHSGSSYDDSWWTAVVTALLECLDGITRREGVVVIGACNDPSRLDAALVRAGRLDHRVEIGLPDEKELEGIFRFHLRDELAEASLRAVCLGAVGCSGADVERIVRAGRQAARNEKRPLAVADLLDGLDGDRAAVPPEVWWVSAIHETGHAVVAIALGIASRVAVSLVLRGAQRGMTRIERRVENLTRAALENEIVIALGGRAAEEVIIGTVSSGSGGAEDSDLAKATGLAIRIVTSYGLSARAPLLWRSPSAAQDILMMSDDVSDEVGDILKSSYARACAVISKHRTAVIAIADMLLNHRGLADEDIRGLLGAVPAQSGKQYCTGAG